MSARGAASWMRARLRELPVELAAMVVGAVLLGALGGAVGLFLGLRTYPLTAWFAVLEVGVPAAAAGSVLGLLVGVVLHWRGRRHSPAGEPVDDDFAGTPPGW